MAICSLHLKFWLEVLWFGISNGHLLAWSKRPKWSRAKKNVKNRKQSQKHIGFNDSFFVCVFLAPLGSFFWIFVSTYIKLNIIVRSYILLQFSLLSVFFDIDLTCFCSSQWFKLRRIRKKTFLSSSRSLYHLLCIGVF